MGFKTIFAIAATTLLAGTGFAEDTESLGGLLIRPGLYDVTISQTESGYANGKRIERPTQSQSGQACLKPDGDLVLPVHFNRPGCEISPVSEEGGQVFYNMACKMGSQSMSGRFVLASGKLRHGIPTYETDDYFRLSGGRAGTQNFSVRGSLNAEEGEVQASLRTEIQYLYSGECPAAQ